MDLKFAICVKEIHTHLISQLIDFLWHYIELLVKILCIFGLLFLFLHYASTYRVNKDEYISVPAAGAVFSGAILARYTSYKNQRRATKTVAEKRLV